MIPVTDLDRARAFYEEKLGLSLKGSLPNGNSVFSL
jgi:catechol 2,3-dioxygenase-like lactoylglutathione lyase family enzyme